MKGRGKGHKNIVYRPQHNSSQPTATPAAAQLEDAPVVFIKQEKDSDKLLYSLPETSSAKRTLANQRLTPTPTLSSSKGEKVHTTPDSLRGNSFAVPPMHDVGGADWNAVAVKKEPPDMSPTPTPNGFQESLKSSLRNSAGSHKRGHFRGSGRGRGCQRSSGGFKIKQ